MSEFINFVNYKQASIFENEIKGQLSDGHWSNAKPFGHWESICRAKIGVSDTPEKHYFNQKSYNLVNKELIDCVGKRMWDVAVLADHFKDKFPLDAYRALQSYTDKFIEFYTEGIPETKDNYVEYLISVLRRYEFKLKDLLEAKEVLENTTYNEKELKKELREMKKLINAK